LLLALASCGTSPEPAFYTLAPVPGTSATDIRDTIKVVQPDLPAFLDRPDFVSQTSRYEISINETANWAEPLASLFERILADDLQQRLPSATVQTDSDFESLRAPRFIIETQLQLFNPADNGEAVLRGDCELTDRQSSRQQPQHFIIDLTVSNTSHTPDAIAAALSNLVGQYADQMSANIIALKPSSNTAQVR
jgi:uncharacterized lipoprotein YmbA